VSNSPKYPDPNSVWTLIEVAEHFGVMKRTVEGWRERSERTRFPDEVFKLGHTYFFDKEEVTRWYGLWTRTHSQGGQRASAKTTVKEH
jgi:hypothetical protein